MEMDVCSVDIRGSFSLALRSGAPRLPIVFYVNEKFKERLSKFQRTNFHIVVGNQFYLDDLGKRITTSIRQDITDEVMYQISALLPLKYRGYYSDLDAATEEYIKFQII